MQFPISRHMVGKGQVDRIRHQSPSSRFASRYRPAARARHRGDLHRGWPRGLAWGRSSSTAANTQEPFAWAIASDNKTIVGADMDGYFRITLISPDSIEKCYTHNGTSSNHSIVATCHVMNRVRR